MTGREWLEVVRTVCGTVFGVSLVWAVAWVLHG